jgi:hypothetical protein
METRKLQRVHEDRATPVDSVTAKIRIVTSMSFFGFCRLGLLLVCLVGLFVVVGSAQAVLGEQQTITQTGGSEYDNFGRSVALSADGNTAIVEAERSATIFTRSGTTWARQQSIVCSSVAISVAVSADGNTVIIGEPEAFVYGQPNHGRATVLIRSGTTWTEQQTITQPIVRAGLLFGSSVALSADGDTAIVGAYGHDVADRGQTYQGSAVVFTRSGSVWTEQQTITKADRAQYDIFGFAVALSADGNTAIVGAYGDDASQGSATVFQRSGSSWAQQQTITQTGGVANEFFGFSVALSSDGNTAIVGAYGDDAHLGSATIFTRSGSSWTQQQTITKADRTQDYFGSSVALSADGNTAIVGASGGGGALMQMSGTFFERSGTAWTEQQTITDGATVNRTLGSVALSADANTAIVGAPGGFANQGSATIFAPIGLPGLPTSVSATSGENGQSIVSWAAPAFNGNSRITRYIVTASPGGASCPWTSGPLSCTVTGLTNGTTYTFTVTATNLAGTGSESSASSAATPSAVSPGLPTNVSATSGENGQSIVSWTAPASDGGLPITRYIVTASPGGASCPWTSGPLSCTVTGLTNGTTYTFTVRATNAAGTSESLSSNGVTPATTPGLPTSVTVTPANGESAVSWLAPVDTGGATITGYTVTASPGGASCPWTSGPLSCTVTGLTNGTTYTFTVRATNAAGTSSASSASASVVPGYALTISTFSGSGTITNSTGTMSCTSVCIANQADAATITATPATGWVFSSWGGACSGATRVCSLLMNQARDVAVFFVEAPASTPPSGGGSGAAPSPTINISNNVTVNVTVTVTTPVNVQWSPTVIGQPTTASFTAAPATTYSISATTVARAAKTVRGSCTVKAGKAICIIKIPAKGKWVVAITPKKKGKVGKPAKKIVKV